jgi:hypothetical protein
MRSSLVMLFKEWPQDLDDRMFGEMGDRIHSRGR